MKRYTDIEQSKKLTEILPIESADMWYSVVDDEPFVCLEQHYEYEQIPCWSLSALLDVLQKTAYSIDEDANVMLCSYKTVEWDLRIDNSDLELVTESNPVDACYEMILKLNELKML